MKTMRLGKTDLLVSRVGIGGIPLTRIPEDEAVKVVRHALDLGVNFIDTARAYKDSEIRIGKVIAGHRDQVIIATKGGWADKAQVQKSIEESLERLNTDYIDVWQFHGIQNVDHLNWVLGRSGVMETAKQAQKEGKIRHIGFSGHNVGAACEAVSTGCFETVQFPFNFIQNEAEERLISLAQEHDIGFIAMKPFAGGAIKDASLAFKYLLQFDNVLPDPGISSVEEIEEIVNIVNNPRNLTSEDRRRMDEIHANVGTRYCRQCEYCMPCPQGVHIPSVMWLQRLYEEWYDHDWYLTWGYVLNGVNSYKKCVQCSECEKKCPFQLPIREMMTENIKFYETVAQAKTK
jgi:predicted aldo/keto reductase-like oxidoreductase